MNRWLIGLCIMVSATACRRESRQPEEQVLVASATLTSAWIRNFNPFSPNALWPTRAGVYEPLLIYNTLTGRYVPWLATSHRWSDDSLSLEFELRKDVQWSDGNGFDADDVVFTFELMKNHPALDTGSVWQRILGIDKLAPHRVRFRLAHPDYPALPVLAHQMIVPEHIWVKVQAPSTFRNETPVGTGPYPIVGSFRTQLFELDKHPNYWKKEAVLAKKLRMPAYQGNDTVSLALVSGDIDWAGHNVPLIERTYIPRDPVHFKYWFPPLGGMVFLFANTTRPPLDDARVRKAISLAIDRNRLVKIGMSGYTQPADGTGLSPVYDRWKCCKTEAEALTRHNPNESQALLRSAGCRKEKNQWTCQGKVLRFGLEVVNGWTDWIRSAQVIKQDLGAIGIHVQVKSYDFGAWFEHVQMGRFDLSIGWSNEGSTPYEFYGGLASSKTVKPVGQAGPTNWHRFADKTFDMLLDTFASTPPGLKREQLVDQMQARFIETLPAIPLFPNPSWGTYSTRHFVGFPNAKKPYAKLSPHADPERLLLMTTIAPRTKNTSDGIADRTGAGGP